MATIDQIRSAAATSKELPDFRCIKLDPPVRAVYKPEHKEVRVTLVDDGKYPGTVHTAELFGWLPASEFELIV